jgi:hypothetical protein
MLCAALALSAAAEAGFAQNRAPGQVPGGVVPPVVVPRDRERDNNKKDDDKESKRERREARREAKEEAREAKQRTDDSPTAATGGQAAQGQAAQGSRATAERALASLYPGATFRLGQPKDVEGTQVYDATVVTPRGETLAQVTEFGDFLVSGAPASEEAAPAPVREVVEGLFKNTQDADALVATQYLVYVRPGRGLYELRLDAAGRLLDVTSQRQLRDQANDPAGKVSDDVRKRLTQAAQTRFANAKLDSVESWSEAEGFYVANITDKGRKGFVIADDRGTVVSQRIDIDVKDLPRPVVRTVNELFDTAKIRSAQKGELQYWQMEQKVGGETVTLKIRPNGDVMSIDSDQPTVRPEEQAVVASQKQKRKNNRGNNNNNNGRRAGVEDGRRSQ